MGGTGLTLMAVGTFLQASNKLWLIGDTKEFYLYWCRIESLPFDS